MNLISCTNCGIVLDADNLHFPVDIYGDDGDGAVDPRWAAWDREKENYVPKVECPVCNNDILKP